MVDVDRLLQVSEPTGVGVTDRRRVNCYGSDDVGGRNRVILTIATTKRPVP